MAKKYKWKYRWYIERGLLTRKGAIKRAKHLRKSGFNVRLQKKTKKGITYWNVLVGYRIN